MKQLYDKSGCLRSIVPEQTSVQPTTVRPYPSSVPLLVICCYVICLADWDSST